MVSYSVHKACESENDIRESCRLEGCSDILIHPRKVGFNIYMKGDLLAKSKLEPDAFLAKAQQLTKEDKTVKVCELRPFPNEVFCLVVYVIMNPVGEYINNNLNNLVSLIFEFAVEKAVA